MNTQRAFLGWTVLGMLLATTAWASSLAPVIRWDQATDIAVGRGERGPWQQNDSRYDYVDDPTVAVDTTGDVLVAWVDQARKDVFLTRLRRSDGRGTPPINVSRTPATFSWLPRIALAPDMPRRIYVLWQEIIFSGGSHGGDILFAHAEDGQTFSEPINLSRSIGGDGKGRITRDIWHNGSLDIAAAAGGIVYAAWTEYDGALWFTRSRDGGTTFSPPRIVAGNRPQAPARAPSLAVAPDGTVYLAWTVGENDAADIHVARSIDGGAAFEAPVVVAPTPTYADAPKVAVDPRGVLHLVYAESVAGPFDAARILYTRSFDRGRTFGKPTTISAREPRASAGFPSISLDGNGHVLVVWEHYSDHRQRPHGLGFALSVNGGDAFGAPAMVPASRNADRGRNGSYQGLLMRKVALGPNGTVAVVNSRLVQNARSRVWLMRGTLLDP